MTQGPPPGGENDRFRDAVDLPLLRDLVATDALGAVREACEATFRARAEHVWPPVIALPTHWRVPFATLAAAVELPVTDLGDAERALRSFVNDLVAAGGPA